MHAYVPRTPTHTQLDVYLCAVPERSQVPEQQSFLCLLGWAALSIAPSMWPEACAQLMVDGGGHGGCLGLAAILHGCQVWLADLQTITLTVSRDRPGAGGRGELSGVQAAVVPASRLLALAVCLQHTYHGSLHLGDALSSVTSHHFFHTDSVHWAPNLAKSP